MATLTEDNIDKRNMAIAGLERAHETERRLGKKLKSFRLGSRTVICASPEYAEYMKKKLRMNI